MPRNAWTGEPGKALPPEVEALLKDKDTTQCKHKRVQQAFDGAVDTLIDTMQEIYPMLGFDDVMKLVAVNFIEAGGVIIREFTSTKKQRPGLCGDLSRLLWASMVASEPGDDTSHIRTVLDGNMKVMEGTTGEIVQYILSVLSIDINKPRRDPEMADRAAGVLLLLSNLLLDVGGKELTKEQLAEARDGLAAAASADLVLSILEPLGEGPSR